MKMFICKTCGYSTSSSIDVVRCHKTHTVKREDSDFHVGDIVMFISRFSLYCDGNRDWAIKLTEGYKLYYVITCIEKDKIHLRTDALINEPGILDDGSRCGFVHPRVRLCRANIVPKYLKEKAAKYVGSRFNTRMI